MDLRRIDLGGFDAESDKRLGEYFVETPYVDEAINGRRTTFLGRKGSGKSSLFAQLPELFKAQGRDVTFVSVTPDQYAWASLKAYREQGLLSEAAHMNAWKLTLAIQVASALATVAFPWSLGAEEAVATLQKFLRSNYGNDKIDLRGAATKLLAGLESFNLSAFGFGAGLKRGVPEPRVLTPAVIEAVMEVIAACVAERGIIVLIDRLDDSWDGSAEAQSLLIGLLKGAKDYNDYFGFRDDFGLKVIVFMRSDIYSALHFDDKDKHRPFEQEITWTPELLKEMVQARLPEDVVVEELFEPGTMRGAAPFDYIVKRTFLRPREVLQFLEESLNEATREAEYISKEDIRDAERRYSRWKLDDLKQEFAKSMPQLADELECLRQGVHRYDALSELEERIAEHSSGEMRDRAPRRVVEDLFDVSAIGVRLRDSGSYRFRCEDSTLTLPMEASVLVHQSLHDGLNIVEKRAPAKD